MARRLCVIGLDCVPPEFLFGPWLDEMPHLARLIEEGVAGNLVSTIPPITVPAWMAMMTSHDPGMLGIYGFRNRASHDYSDVFTVNSTYVKARTLWDHLSHHRLRSIVLGVPLTYPVRPLRGVMASSFLTPDKSVQWTWPESLAARLDEAAGGEYIIDVRDFRNERKQETLDQIHRMTRARFRAFRHLVQTEQWDFAMMVEMGPDRMHHAFWRYTDPAHRLFEPDNPFATAMHDYYIALDAEVGRTLDALPADTSVIVVSDHGARAMHGAVCINEWLIEQGLLALKSYPDSPVKLTTDRIDWSGTKAWAAGGYYARVFLNIEGREPAGQIAASEAAAFRSSLRERIEAIPDESGNAIGTRVFFPAEVYRECRNTPPDLIVYLGNLDWRSAGTVGHGRGTIHIFDNDTGPDDANHAQEGVFVWYGRKRATTLPGGKVSIYDVAPSILDYFGITPPPEMIGRII